MREEHYEDDPHKNIKASKGVRILGWCLIGGGVIFIPLFFLNYCIGPGLNLYGILLTVMVINAIFCGVGLLKLNNKARILLLWFIWLAGTVLLLNFIGMATGYSMGIENICDGLFSWALCYGWVAALITKFLLHPNLKKQFVKS